MPDTSDWSHSLADLFDPPPRRASHWYCEREECDGKPHDHWTDRHARHSQRPPGKFASGGARVWVVMAGRGWGKTATGAHWLAHQAKLADDQRRPDDPTPPTEWGLVAPTFRDLRRTCIEGESGLLYAFDELRVHPEFRYNRSLLEVTLPNGTKILTFSADTPERVRGPNLSGCWMDEIAQNQGRYLETYRLLSMAIRKQGTACQFVCTTTPAPVPLVREFTDRTDGSVVITRGSTFENRDNLSEAFIQDMQTRYRGTRFEKQELFGELLEDVPGALWTPSMIERGRLSLEGGPGRMGLSDA